MLESVVKTKKSLEQSRQRACVMFERAGADPPDLDRGLNLSDVKVRGMGLSMVMVSYFLFF